jgi:FkbM family methyltransferase
VPRTISKAGIAYRVAGPDSFWDWYESDDWEPETVAVYDRFLRAGATYVDLGAWIGPTVLLAASKAGRIVCAEPDPQAYPVLLENLALNPEVAAKTTAFPVAIGASDGEVVLSSQGEGGDSNSSVMRPGDAGARWTVEQVTMATLLERAAIASPDFVKVDVEGAEYDIVTMLVRAPALFVAMHPNLLLDKRSPVARVVSSLRALRANRRFLRTVLAYRHHYVWDESRRRFREIRRRNLLRVLFPLPLRSSFLIGACLFTDEPVA